MINDLVFARRQEVIAALNIAGIPTNTDITPENLYGVVMNELNNQNEELYTTLGTVIDNTFDLSNLSSNEVFSGQDGTTTTNTGGGFFSKVDWGSVASNGVSLLTNFFGKKDEAPTYTPPASTGGGGVDTNTLLLMQQQQQAAQNARDEERRREEAKRSATTMWVVGGIATVLVVGGIITAVIISKNKAAKAV